MIFANIKAKAQLKCYVFVLLMLVDACCVAPRARVYYIMCDLG